jgi:hypothetical protein
LYTIMLNLEGSGPDLSAFHLENILKILETIS